MTMPSDPDGDYGPRSLDLSVPSAARIYDWYLGGAHNFVVDREFGARIEQALPSVKPMAAANRSFLRRVVRYLLDRGIRQFIDLGSGIPTAGNVHEIAQAASAEARVVYVDYEPVAYTHARRLLHGNPLATIVQADLRQPEAILDHPRTRQLIDLSRPVGLLMIAVLPFVPDRDDPAGLISTYRSRLAPGSYLAISHLSDQIAPPDLATQLATLVDSYQGADQGLVMRTREQIAAWLNGTEVVPPGVVPLTEWYPDQPESGDEISRYIGWGVVARIPDSPAS